MLSTEQRRNSYGSSQFYLRIRTIKNKKKEGNRQYAYLRRRDPARPGFFEEHYLGKKFLSSEDLSEINRIFCGKCDKDELMNHIRGIGCEERT